MSSSDEEGEIMPDCVADYVFFNQENKHVSFSCLPLIRGKAEDFDNTSMRIFLSGTYDDGLQKFYKQVIAWRYVLSYVQPEISVLCKGSHWIKLLKPKNIFEPEIRSLLITIHCLNFVKHNLEASEESVWCHLSRVFSAYEIGPSEVACMYHIPLIKDAAENDNDLGSSKCIIGILSEQPAKRKVLHMDGSPARRPEFIVDEDVDDHSENDALAENEDELFDPCCSLCDNGGEVLCCEGRCMRSFHATVASGEGLCETLGFSQAQVDAIPNFICKNCQYQQHQCFICGKLGSSDISSNAEVIPCVAANCGRFYHPKCVAEKLQKVNDIEKEELEKKIAAGESFACPAHNCFVCKQVEDRNVYDMQFAVCRRCPKSYHRKCLPSSIPFETNEEEGILQRAWDDDLLPKRILIYCLDHEIIPDLGTPLRDHIRFPDTGKEKKRALEQLVNRVSLQKKRIKISGHSPTKSAVMRTAKHGEEIHSSFRSESATLAAKGFCGPGSDAQKKSNISNLISASRGHVKSFPNASASSMGTGVRSVLEKNKLSSIKILKPYSVKPGNANNSCKKPNTVSSAKPVTGKKVCSSPVIDVDMQRRIIALIENVNSSFDMDKFRKKHKIPSTYKNSRVGPDRNLTKGKIEVAVKAIRTALEKLNNGGTVDDAKAYCGSEMLRQVPLWKKKLDVYLAPFLHGNRYSSYGRHFTKLEKLEEVVDRLHLYVQDGDTIVDFCCGSNDFSCLMRDKLESVGKKCSFKNYDLFPSKNNFNFEQRDWFSVDPKELPEGSQLIMGLNPPFGVKASLANKFINHALKFQPKLLILIVPPETQRLDSRTDGKKYDLVWEDDYLLSGKSFYLPGSIDIHDKQISQWNNNVPTLSLWSRPDWTGNHRAIAKKYDHFWLPGQSRNYQPPSWNYLQEEEPQDCYGEFSCLMNGYNGDLSNILDNIHEDTDEHELNTYKKFVMSKDSISSIPTTFENSTFIPSFPLTMKNAPVWDQENVSNFSPLSDLEDMEISPTNSPSNYVY